MQYFRYFKGKFSEIRFDELVAEDRPPEVAPGQTKRIERMVYLDR